MVVMLTFRSMVGLLIGEIIMKALYKFYEVVIINSSRAALAEINGLKGAILGMVENDKGKWSYSIHILDTEECWDTTEDEIITTGQIMAREDFYDGQTVAVGVDSKTGEGKITS